nr:fucosyltransferase transcript variant 2 [Fagopyrum tataricum]
MYPSTGSSYASSSSSSSSMRTGTSSHENPKKKWCNLMPLFVALVFIAEIAFLGRLDVAKNAVLVNSWWSDSFYTSDFQHTSHSNSDSHGISSDEEDESCESWLEREDAVIYSRDFQTDPILVSGIEEDSQACSIGCVLRRYIQDKRDAAFSPQEDGIAGIHRSMESSEYYADNKIANARRNGYTIVMTTSLSSDVPVGYFSWAEYDIMAPIQEKNESALAAAFISNCGARNFRLQALEALERSGIKIDSYGSCHKNREEKGTIPVVVGAPNIQEFAPYPGSVLHIKELVDVSSVAKTMKHLADNPNAYNQSLKWKHEGPSDSFKALLDMSAVHSSCRLCIHLATNIRGREENNSLSRKRPCSCTRGDETVYHVYVRERGTFEMESIFLRSDNLTLKALKHAVLEKFNSLKHVPIWKQERPESLRGGDELKIYRIYPLGLTQRQALYTFKFQGDANFRSHIQSNPCSKFEVIFV